MTVRQLLASVDSHELTEWMAYDSIDPIGDDRADYLAAMVCAATLAPYSKHAPDPRKLMPRWDGSAPPVKQTDPEEIKRRMIAFTRKMGGEVT